MRLNKKHIVFIVVFVLFIVSVVYRILNPFVQATVDELTYGSQKVSSKLTNISVPIQTPQPIKKNDPESLVDRFLTKTQMSVELFQDLFKIYVPPQKRRPPSIDTTPKMPVTIAKKDPVQDIKTYITSYTFQGFYESNDQKAIFLSKDKLVLVARVGDRLDGKYLIADIQNKYIKIKLLDLNETIRLDLREFNNE